MLLDALDLPAVLAGISAPSTAWQPGRQRAGQVQEELETWLSQEAPMHGPFLLAWAAAVLQAFPEPQHREHLFICSYLGHTKKRCTSRRMLSRP